MKFRNFKLSLYDYIQLTSYIDELSMVDVSFYVKFDIIICHYYIILKKLISSVILAAC